MCLLAAQKCLSVAAFFRGEAAGERVKCVMPQFVSDDGTQGLLTFNVAAACCVTAIRSALESLAGTLLAARHQEEEE